MSPRNILVQRTEQDVSYHIFDFEKTQVLNEPISIEDRQGHCRGQICAEELSIICTVDEVQECFRSYFNPKEWDFESEEGLPFPERPEVADILNRRDIRSVTLGKYNRTDREMMSARIPYACPATGGRKYPGQLNFKVEHYLSCAGYDNARHYECKTTEILIAAKRHNCHDTIVDLLAGATGRVESAFLKAEFEGILERGSIEYLEPPKQAIKKLMHIIDELYRTRENEDVFRSLSDRAREKV